MPSIVVDSGPLIALFDGSDRYHLAAVAALKANQRPLLTVQAVLAEVCWCLDFSVNAQLDFSRWAMAAIEIDDHSKVDLPRICQIVDKYRDLTADFADAALVALCERRGIFDVLSVDAEFTIYRACAKQKFNNLFPAQAKRRAKNDAY